MPIDVVYNKELDTYIFTLGRGLYEINDTLFDIKEYSSIISVKEKPVICSVTNINEVDYVFSKKNNRKISYAEYLNIRDGFLAFKNPDGWVSLEKEYEYRKFELEWSIINKVVTKKQNLEISIRNIDQESKNPYITAGYFIGDLNNAYCFYDRRKFYEDEITKLLSGLGLVKKDNFYSLALNEYGLYKFNNEISIYLSSRYESKNFKYEINTYKIIDIYHKLDNLYKSDQKEIEKIKNYIELQNLKNKDISNRLPKLAELINLIDSKLYSLRMNIRSTKRDLENYEAFCRKFNELKTEFFK